MYVRIKFRNIVGSIVALYISYFRRVQAFPQVEKLYERGVSDYLVGSYTLFLKT